jgi:2-polyprenyl-6-hydroxyphenyl methylase/3-demethylubiquinone-9 3-methyltransferase
LSLCTEKFAETGEKFDAVVSLEVMEHVDEPETFLSSIRPLVHEGGLVFLSTMNKTPQSFLKTIIAAEVVLGMVPKGTHDWEKYITPMDMSRMLAVNGFKDVEFSGIVVKNIDCGLGSRGIE